MLSILAGCASTDAPITTAPPTPLQVIAPKGSTEADDLIAAAANLDQAAAIGILRSDDPAVTCAHSALKAAGLEGATEEAKSFTPKLSGPLSEGSVLYIRAQQLKAAQPIRLPTGCGDLLIQIRLDAIRAAARTAPLLR
jgi:hypothetical protein